ncbi:DUF2946 domain-containing protein [Enterobacteriaceae bacterium 4M9]|nr:DUF2946 domain-containing protein [Enterobacteriaceae bacterium 4M9]
MLFVAPVISRTLAHHAACQPEHTTATMDMSAMHHDMEMTAHCEENSRLKHSMMPAPSMSPMEEIACGYCQLLINLPFVLFIFAALLWLLLRIVHQSPVIALNCSPVYRTWPPQRARAPPAVALL